MHLPLPLAAAIEHLSSLPGIGPKSGMRLAVHLLDRPAHEVQDLARTLADLHQKMQFCDHCGGFSEQKHCRICTHPKRDQSTVCVVEQPVDVLMLERGASFQGRYQRLTWSLVTCGWHTCQKFMVKKLGSSCRTRSNPRTHFGYKCHSRW